MTATCARFVHDKRQSVVEAAFTATSLHPVVLRPATVLRGYPGDHLIGIHDVARLAVDTVRRINPQAWCAIGVMGNLIHVRGAEPRAGMAVLGPADRAAHLGVHEQV